jgi:flagellar basal body-associated protein FliL
VEKKIKKPGNFLFGSKKTILLIVILTFFVVGIGLGIYFVTQGREDPTVKLVTTNQVPLLLYQLTNQPLQILISTTSGTRMIM